VPSLKSTASIVPEILSIKYSPVFSRKPNDVITEPICTTEKCQHLRNEKRYLKKKHATPPHFKRPPKQAEKKFHVVYTLNHFAPKMIAYSYVRMYCRYSSSFCLRLDIFTCRYAVSKKKKPLQS